MDKKTVYLILSLIGAPIMMLGFIETIESISGVQGERVVDYGQFWRNFCVAMVGAIITLIGLISMKREEDKMPEELAKVFYG